MLLPHLASRLYGTPLLIARTKLDVILAVLGSRIGLDLAPPEAGLPSSRARPGASPPGIALIPVHGTLVRRALGVEAASGLTSYTEIGAQLDAALADPAVHGILLDVDSPGGEAGGVFELAARIRAASEMKPVWAHANDAAFSAAYAIAAAANRVTLSQTAGVGSIGVIALHVDQSVKDAREGLTYTAIFAGQHKNDLSPHAPLSPRAAAELQAEVDRLYGIFVGQVAEMRGLEPDAVRALEAGLLFGDAALGAGLADGIASLEQVTAEFAATLAAQQRLLQPARGTHSASATSPISLTPCPTDSESPMQVQATSAVDDGSQPVPAPQAVAGAPTAAPAAQAVQQARSEAQAIAELCLIAGAPARTAEFLSAGLSEAQVRRTLLDARAEQPEIASRITADAGTSLRPDASPVVAAVKKLITRE